MAVEITNTDSRLFHSLLFDCGIVCPVVSDLLRHIVGKDSPFHCERLSFSGVEVCKHVVPEATIAFSYIEKVPNIP